MLPLDLVFIKRETIKHSAVLCFTGVLCRWQQRQSHHHKPAHLTVCRSQAGHTRVCVCVLTENVSACTIRRRVSMHACVRTQAVVSVLRSNDHWSPVSCSSDNQGQPYSGMKVNRRWWRVSFFFFFYSHISSIFKLSFLGFSVTDAETTQLQYLLLVCQD